MAEQIQLSQPVTEQTHGAPLDDRTGLPLLVAPRNLGEYQSSQISFHHPWGRIWESKVPRPDTEQMLRTSWGQWIPNRYHNDGSETAVHQFIKGDEVPVPESEDDQLGLILVEQFGYLPRNVIDTSEGQLKVRPMGKGERRLARQQPDIYLTPDIIQKFWRKWHPTESYGAARKALMDYQARQTRYSYRDIDGGSYNHVHSFLGATMLQREMGGTNGRLCRRLLEQNDPEADAELLGVVVRALVGSVTLHGKPIRQVYNRLLKTRSLYNDMPPDIESFLEFRLANPAGGLALRAATREQLLGRTAAEAVA